MAEISTLFSKLPGFEAAMLEYHGEFQYFGIVIRDSNNQNILCVLRRQVKDQKGTNDRKLVPVDYMSADGNNVIPHGFLRYFDKYNPRTPQNLTQVRELMHLPKPNDPTADDLRLKRLQSEIGIQPTPS